jgi:hypothetical protein
MATAAKRVVKNGGRTGRRCAKQDYRSIQMHCGLCGQPFAEGVFHYLQKGEDGREFIAAHPLAPLLCARCARDKSKHGRRACIVWERAKCVVSDEALETNATLH